MSRGDALPSIGAIGWTVGLISGTSADGIDVAAIATDGRRVLRYGPSGIYPYRPETRAQVLALAATGEAPDRRMADELAHAVEIDHVDAFAHWRAAHGIGLDEISLIGFHGQTVFHDPGAGITVQLGHPGRIAARLGVKTVGHLRRADMANGGEGAPIVPLYHAALLDGSDQPTAILNIGGVSNVTLVTETGVAACDVGPGNAALDDWVRAHLGEDFDRDGMIAARGHVDVERVQKALNHPYFTRHGPRSLDRNAFTAGMVEGLSLEDGAATLVAITAASITRAAETLVPQPMRWLVCGGGRHNRTLMAALAERLAVPINPVECIGLDGDAIEAQAIAFLAMRSQLGLPLTVPTTTGCRTPTCGGEAFDAAGQPSLFTALR